MENITRKKLNYRFEVGETIHSLKILSKIQIESGRQKHKGYMCECVDCGYVGKFYESSLLKEEFKCRVCIGAETKRGINDIATTDNWMVEYFEDEDVAYTHTSGSNKSVSVKCPHCGERKNIRIVRLRDSHGIGCLCCSGGYYTERFFSSILNQLGIKFKRQLTSKTFDWVGSYRYDFYFEFKGESYIVEINGQQHYNQNTLFNGSNDYDKMVLAGNYVDHYIALDFSKSNIEYIKNAVLNSQLPLFLCFDECSIDWGECNNSALSNSLVEDVYEYILSNDDINIRSLSDRFNIGYEKINNIISTLVKSGRLDSDPITRRKKAGGTLCVGMVVKNYKELCSILGVETKTGKSKQLQLEDFARYFSWDKDGNKFIITDIYDTPISKEDSRSLGNRNKYCKYIERNILKYLLSKNDSYISMPLRRWYGIAGLVGDDFNKYESNRSALSTMYLVDEKYIDDFYFRAKSKIRAIFRSAINNLEKRKVVMCSEDIIISYTVNGSEKKCVAEDYEKEEILNAEYYVLHDVMGYDNIGQVYLHRKDSEFYRLVSEYIYDMYGYKFYYRVLNIIPVDKKYIIQELEKYDDDNSVAKLKETLCDYLNNEAIKKYEQSVENFSKEGGWVLRKDYVEMQHKLSEMLILGAKGSIVMNAIDGFIDDEIDMLFN